MLLLDEAFGACDVFNRGERWAVLQTLWAELLTSSVLSEGQCGFHRRDSLEVRGATLTRYTPLRGGVTLEEDYQRR